MEKIRRLTKEDYSDVFELEKQVHHIHYSNRPDLYNDVSDLFPKDYYDSIIDDNNSITIGMECDNKVIGILLSNIREAGSISVIKKRKYCFIDDIVIDEKYRRKGYAKKLFNELKSKCNELDIDNIELVVWPFNKEALAFYESLGMSVKNFKYELNLKSKVNTSRMEVNTSQNTKE